MPRLTKSLKAWYASYARANPGFAITTINDFTIGRLGDINNSYFSIKAVECKYFFFVLVSEWELHWEKLWASIYSRIKIASEAMSTFITIIKDSGFTVSDRTYKDISHMLPS